MTTITEPARSIPVVNTCDVLVCGAGPAGICAALAAARQGAKVQIVEAGHCLGGMMTLGCMNNPLDCFDKGGLTDEIIAGLYDAHQIKPGQYPRQVFDVELTKRYFDKLLLDAGVSIRLYTFIVGAQVEQGRLTTIITESKSGREAWQAKLFIDTTGDGDIGAHAGCGYDIGDPNTGNCQPVSMLFEMAGFGYPDQEPFNIPERVEQKNWLRKKLQQGGHDPSLSLPGFGMIRPGRVSVGANHQYGYRKPDAQFLTDATLEARKECHDVVAAMKKADPVFTDIYMTQSCSHIAVRESRRIHGLYTLTEEDLINGSEFPDAICRVHFKVDIHSIDPGKDKGLGNGGVVAQPYNIPLRSLIARDITGLMMAGRCISGVFYAHASYRVIGNAFAMGQAAGFTAAWAVQNDCRPQDMDNDTLKGLLNKNKMLT